MLVVHRMAAVVAALAFAWPRIGVAAPPEASAPAGDVAPASAPTAPAADTGAMPAGFDRCEKHRGNERFRITLPKEAELTDLVHWMSSVSCQKFIWEPKVRGGKATILAPEPVTMQEAFAAFHAALQTMGLTVEGAGDFYKIVESADAANHALPLYGTDAQAPATDRYVTQLYRVKAAAPEQLRSLLDSLKTKPGRVDVVGELLLITDTGTNLARMLRLLEEVDRAAAPTERIYFRQLRHAAPEAIAAVVRDVFGVPTGGATGKSSATTTPRAGTKAPAAGTASEPVAGAEQTATASRVLVDEHTQALVIVARPGDYATIAKLIDRLDVPLSGGAARFHLVPLSNADPVEVADVLTALASASASAGKDKPAGKNGAAAAAGGSVPSFGADIRVTADPATRSLVIYATQADFLTLEPIIRGLDVERRQVYIEVYLLELTVERLVSAGAGAHFGRTKNVGSGTASGDAVAFAASAPSSTHNSVVLDPSVLSGLAAGIVGPVIPGSQAIFGRDVPAFGVVIQALQTDNDVNVVAEPHIYTADNREALIEVGDQKPVPGNIANTIGTTSNGVSSLIPGTSVQQRDIKLSLKVTPHVNDGKSLSLDVELDNENFVEATNLGVSTTKRKLKLEQVLARDGQPLVLGGLIKEVERDNTSGVPGLSKIPLLGWAFKSRKKQKEKVNLLMILVPHVLDGPDDMRRIHKRRMEERLDFLERYSAFKRKDLDTAINYKRKSGLLSAVDAEARRMHTELAEREVAERELQRTDVSGEIGLVPSTEP